MFVCSYTAETTHSQKEPDLLIFTFRSKAKFIYHLFRTESTQGHMREESNKAHSFIAIISF